MRAPAAAGAPGDDHPVRGFTTHSGDVSRTSVDLRASGGAVSITWAEYAQRAETPSREGWPRTACVRRRVELMLTNRRRRPYRIDR